MPPPPKTYSVNEAIELVHRNAAFIFRQIANLITERDLSGPEVAEILRNSADENDAQAEVVRMRDVLGYSGPTNDPQRAGE